jgi:hypothetical protein
VNHTLLLALLLSFILFSAVSAADKTAIALETSPVFESPGPGLLAKGFIDKRDTCAIDSTCVDSLGTAWFHVRPGNGKHGGGWVPAKALAYASDVPSDFASQAATGDEDKKRRLEILKEHAQWPRRIVKAVRNGQICLDMSEEQVVASWGQPSEKRQTFMIGVGEYLTLLYPAAKKGTLVVSLQNDRVIGWTTDR